MWQREKNLQPHESRRSSLLLRNNPATKVNINSSFNSPTLRSLGENVQPLPLGGLLFNWKVRFFLLGLSISPKVWFECVKWYKFCKNWNLFVLYSIYPFLGKSSTFFWCFIEVHSFSINQVKPKVHLRKSLICGWRRSLLFWGHRRVIIAGFACPSCFCCWVHSGQLLLGLDLIYSCRFRDLHLHRVQWYAWISWCLVK